MGKFKIVTLNARGLGDFRKRREVFNMCHSKGYDIIFVQETHSTKRVENLWKSEFGGKIYFSHGTSQARGVAILIRKNVNIDICDVERDADGRFLLVRTKYLENKLALINMYAPNIDDPGFFQECLNKVDISGCDRKIIGGDFNLVMDNLLDRNTGTHKNVLAKKALTDMTEEMNLVDAWRQMYPTKPGYTWERRKPYKLQERLDFFIVSEEFMQYVNRAWVSPNHKSDHSIVVMEIIFDPIKRGPGYWKLNNDLLNDRDYVEAINKVIEKELSQAELYKSKRKHWEVMKLMFRQSSIQFSKAKQLDRKNRKAVIEKKLEFYRKAEELTGILTDNETHIRKLKQELQTIQEYKTQGAILRARADWLFAGQKPTKYFLNLEKSNYNRKTIQRLENSEGKTIQGKQEILNEITGFYKELYADNTSFDDTYVKDLVTPKISDQSREELEKDITMGEIAQAVKDIKPNKVPGTDGLTGNFYKMFFGKLKDYIYLMIQEIVHSKELHLSARRGIISLLEKPGRDRIYLRNWRPISLLNTDLKIFAKIIANRIQKVIEQFIHESQTGFMKNRLMAENIVRLLSIIDHCQNQDRSGLVISFDFMKAFDKVKWKAIYVALEKFNFGPKMIQLVQILYNNPISTVMNNGYWGEWFSLERSTRQGCVASPSIFVIVVEILGIKIRQNAQIVGLESERFTFKAMQYADDIWVALEPEEKNLNNLLEEMQEFCRFSGLEINYEKTAILRIGPMWRTNAEFYTQKPLHWAKGPIKVLGIMITPDVEELLDFNYGPVIEKIENVLSLWSYRNLTLMGKITVVNSLVASQITHLFMALPSPPTFYMNFFKRQIQDYLWKGGIPRIRYTKLVQEYDKGGLKLVDLEEKDLAMKRKWVENLRNREVPWFYEFLPIKDERIWQTNTSSNDVKKYMKNTRNDFPAQVWFAWSKYNFMTPLTESEMASQILWGNSFIRRINKPIFDNKLVNSNIDYVYQLIDVEKGQFFSWEILFEQYGQEFDQLFYAGLKSAIPNVWRISVKEIVQFDFAPEDTKYLRGIERRITTKMIYWEYVNKKYKPDGCKTAWEIELDRKFSQEEWDELVPKIFKVTTSVTLRYFQYRIVNRILTTNYMRSKWNKEIDEKCVFCKRKTETVVHMLFECPQVMQLWQALIRWIKYFWKIDLKLNLSIVILNNYDGEEKWLINTVILIMKRYVYVSKCMENQLSFQAYIVQVTETCRTEKYAAIKYDRIKVFNKKWKKFLSA